MEQIEEINYQINGIIESEFQKVSAHVNNVAGQNIKKLQSQIAQYNSQINEKVVFAPTIQKYIFY